MKKLLSSLAAAVLLIVFTRPATAVDRMPWAADIASARQLAAARNQLVLLHFSADSCPPCRRLEQRVFNQESFGHAIGEMLVPVKINVSNYPDLAREFNVRAWPTDIVMTPQGQELHRMVSPQNRDEYLSVLRQLVWRVKSTPQPSTLAQFPLQKPDNTRALHTPPLERSAMPPAGGGQVGYIGQSSQQPSAWQSTAATSPSQLGQTAATPPRTEAFAPPQAVAANAATNQNRQQPTYIPQAVYHSQPEVISSPRPQMVSNTYAAQSTTPAAAYQQPSRGGPNGASGSSPASQLMTNQYAADYVAPASARNATPHNIQAGGPAAYPAQNHTSEFQQQVPASASLQRDVIPVSASNASPPAPTAPARTNHPPSTPQMVEVGLQGYCPVTLLEENKWTSGDKRWGARHRGRVYLFATAAAQQKFLANPDQFSPLLAGFDPVAFFDQSQYLNGYRAHGIRYREQIILFSSEENLQRFAQEPTKYVDYVSQAMRGDPSNR